MTKLEKFARLSVGIPLCLLTLLVLGPLALTGCAKPAPQLTIPVPESLRAPCPRPDPEKVQTVGDLAAFSVEQEASVSICEARKDAAVAIIDAHAKVQEKPAPWWRRLLPP